MWDFSKLHYNIVFTSMSLLRRCIVNTLNDLATPWLTPELFTAIHDKQKAKVRTECARDPGNFEQYRRLKNKLKMQIKSAKLKHLRGILGRIKDNSHSAFDLWQAVNQIIGRSSTIKSKLPGNLSLDSINNFLYCCYYS